MMTLRQRTFRLVATTVLALGVASAGVRIVDLVATRPVPSRSGSHFTVSKEIAGAQAAKTDHAYPVAVPQENLVSILSATKAPRFVIAHGLSDSMPLNVARTTLVSLRPTYSGRFAPHFHGDDGSHLELTYLNVMPAQGTYK
jgi:hypothetical protein